MIEEVSLNQLMVMRWPGQLAIQSRKEESLEGTEAELLLVKETKRKYGRGSRASFQLLPVD